MSPTPTTQQSRRSLGKTRTGCRTCKKRKIKCDEGRPVCRNCVKHRAECTFDDATKKKAQLPSPSPSALPGSPGNAATTGLFTVTDLELLHHYTTSTCLSISTDPVARNFWRINIPQLGFTTPYILESIMSLSALHLARFKAERRDFYHAEAFRHHTTALTMASPLIGNPTVENCEHLFLFSSITNIFSFAQPKDPANLLVSSSHAVPDWLYLFRGVRALMDLRRTSMPRSSFAPMFQEDRRLHHIWDGNLFESEAFGDLEANLKGSSNTFEDPDRMSVLLGALRDLKKSFALAFDPHLADENKVRGVFIWLLEIKDPYIKLVNDENSEALCILAFFCVLLNRLNFIWWLEGWGVHLVGRLHSILDDTHRLWIRWPIEEIGWVPC